MPELPEVETICHNLKYGTSPDKGHSTPALLGKTITGTDLYWARTLATPSPEEFRSRVTGQTIQDIGRRGKYLIINLSDDYLLFHLRMSGDLLVEPESMPVAAHHRMVLHFRDDWRLAFNDTRKFGRVWLVDDPQSVLEGLGPEPLDPDFTPQMLHQRLQKHHRRLKPLLLDQSFLAGLGNIYTDEALHLAHLHPLTLSDSLTFPQSYRLWHSIRQVLKESIRRSGASIDWVYRGGDFQNYFRVYQREGEACPECGATIQRIVVGQRGTHFCPSCQPAPPGAAGT